MEPLKENLAQVGCELPSADYSCCHTSNVIEPTAFMSVILNVANAWEQNQELLNRKETRGSNCNSLVKKGFLKCISLV